TIGGGATLADWRSAGTAASFDVHASLTPLPLISLLGELSGGRRGNSFFTDSLRPYTLSRRSGYRFGGELNYRRLHVGAAMVHVKTDSVPSFGLPFDSIAQMYPGGSLNGFEGYGTIPLPLRAL